MEARMCLCRRFATLLFVVLVAVGFAFVSKITAAESAPEATGRPILDQHNTEVLSSTINGGTAAYEWQQGITVGIGGQLTRIALYVVIDEESYGETVATTLSLRLGSPWQNDAPVWTVTEVLRPGWNTFTLTNQKIFVDVGDEYAIGIHGQSSGNNFNPGFAISYEDQYPGGDLFLNGSSAETEGNDLVFRTYVRPKRIQHP
jgi:hypothetical protein